MIVLLLALASPSPSPSPSPDDEVTALNSKQWVHAAFFNRIKKLASAEWHGDAEYLRHGGKKLSGPLKTTVRVALDASGRLRKVSIEVSSGLEFLDDEALAAFVRAAPYPLPPPALIKDGEVAFLFSFVVSAAGP